MKARHNHMNKITPEATVEEFQRWWLKVGCPLRPPFKDGVFTTDIAYSLVLFRESPFQVELYICKPNTNAPFHQHPGVDSSFIYLTGNLDFGRSDGKYTDLKEYQKARLNSTVHHLLGQSVSAPNGALHTLKVYAEGGAFLSFEKWNEQDPTSVTINWKGEAVGEEHKEILGNAHKHW